MSSNRLIYDTCAYKHTLSQSVGPLAYVLDPSKYEHCHKCRIELGVVGGTAVSHIKGNLVDLETDLRGQTRLASKCPELKYQMPCPVKGTNNCQPQSIVIRGNPSNQGRVINTGLQHLPACQMFRYKPVPLPPPVNYYKCPQ